MLTIQPESNNSGLWRNLLDAAEKTKEKALITKILAWMNSSESKHGKELGYASDIGDRLARNGLKAEAKQWWEAHLNINPNSDENGYLSDRLLKLVEEPDQKIPVIEKLLKVHSSQQGKYASWLADIYFDKKEYGKMEQVLRQARQRRDADPLSEWTMGDNPAQTWVDAIRADKEADDAAKSRIFNLVADTHANSSSGLARLALLELDSAKQVPIIERLKTHRNATLANYNHHHNFDRLMSYAQAAQGPKIIQSPLPCSQTCWPISQLLTRLVKTRHAPWLRKPTLAWVRLVLLLTKTARWLPIADRFALTPRRQDFCTRLLQGKRSSF